MTLHPYTRDEAEADLAAAFAAGDEQQITLLAPVVDAHDTHQDVTLHAAALYYASVGLRVFPLQPGTKIPLKGSHGCLDATDDTDRITRWWTGNPHANLGIATGHLVDVVDVDGLVGQRSRVHHWEDLFERIDGDAVGKVLTPRKGGMHIYVPATGDGNATNIVDSVDYRGVGGYVVAPPSRTDVGAYRWLGTLDLGALSDKEAS